MKRLIFAIFAAGLLTAGSGCCCFWHDLHEWKSSLLPCGGPNCGTHYLQPHGAQYGAYCGSCFRDGCGSAVGGGCATGGCATGGCATGGCATDGYAAGGCAVGDCGVAACGCGGAGCGGHGGRFLDLLGASWCGASGCGQMYWGDYHAVPPTYDPCDRHANWVGPPYAGNPPPEMYPPLSAGGAAGSAGPVLHHGHAVINQQPAATTAAKSNAGKNVRR